MKKSLLLLALLTLGCSKKPVDMDEVLFDRAVIKMVISATQAPIGMGRSMVVGLAGIKTARRNMKVIIIKASK